jgi:hypothetical protein
MTNSNKLADALRILIEHCVVSDDLCYGTMSTAFVRKIAEEALAEHDAQPAPAPAQADDRWITQTRFYDPARPADVCSGNCTEAALASILGLRLEDVPSFYGLRTSEYWQALTDFCTSRGFELYRIDGERIYDGLYLVDGPSERGCGHFVVMRNGKLVHDPHPSRAGLRSIVNTWLLLPHDPAIAVVRNGEQR